MALKIFELENGGKPAVGRAIPFSACVPLAISLAGEKLIQKCPLSCYAYLVKDRVRMSQQDKRFFKLMQKCFADLFCFWQSNSLKKSLNSPQKR
jgi:hypothetical protein